MLYKSVVTCHPVSLQCKGTSILIFASFTCGYDLYNHQYNLYTHGCDVFMFMQRMFCTLPHVSSIHMGAINFYMQERFSHLLI